MVFYPFCTFWPQTKQWQTNNIQVICLVWLLPYSGRNWTTLVPVNAEEALVIIRWREEALVMTQMGQYKNTKRNLSIVTVIRTFLEMRRSCIEIRPHLYRLCKFRPVWWTYSLCSCCWRLDRTPGSRSVTFDFCKKKRDNQVTVQKCLTVLISISICW